PHPQTPLPQVGEGRVDLLPSPPWDSVRQHRSKLHLRVRPENRNCAWSNELAHRLPWGGACLAFGVFISRGEKGAARCTFRGGEGVSPLFDSYVGRHTGAGWAHGRD